MDSTTPASTPSEEVVRRFRHKKRGTVYEVIGRAELQMNCDLLVDGSEMVVYRGEDGRLWVREESEFSDGRFEEVQALTLPIPADTAALVERLLVLTSQDTRGGATGFEVHGIFGSLSEARSHVIKDTVGHQVGDWQESRYGPPGSLEMNVGYVHWCISQQRVSSCAIQALTLPIPADSQLQAERLAYEEQILALEMDIERLKNGEQPIYAGLNASELACGTYHPGDDA